MVRPTPEHEYEDPDSYGSSKELSFKDITLSLMKKALDESSKECSAEMGIVKRFINGEVIELFLPNQREIVINSVNACCLWLGDKINKCDNKDIKGKFEQLSQKLITLDLWIKDQDDKLNMLQQKISPKYMNPETYKQRIAEYNTKISDLSKTYEYRKHSIHLELLGALSLLCSHNNYFDKKGNVF